jgi:hypothetical protein
VSAERLDFYQNLGDLIYETASNVNGNIGTSYLNSPSVTLSNDSLNFNGIPRAFVPNAAPFATHTQLKADYEKEVSRELLAGETLVVKTVCKCCMPARATTPLGTTTNWVTESTSTAVHQQEDR